MHPHRRRLLAHRDHKKPNGDWDFRALANGKGIFADTVFTGRLSDAAGLNYWDMDTGDFSLSARSTIGGKTVQQYADGAVSDANSYTDAAKQAAITEPSVRPTRPIRPSSRRRGSTPRPRPRMR